MDNLNETRALSKKFFTDYPIHKNIVKRIYEYEYTVKLSFEEFETLKNNMFDCVEDENGFLIKRIDYELSTGFSKIKKIKEVNIKPNSIIV
jgi:hypothetical protein